MYEKALETQGSNLASGRTQRVILFSRSSFSDIDHYLEQAGEQFAADLVQLDPGPMNLAEELIELGDVQIVRIRTDNRLFERYSLPAGQFRVGFAPPATYPQYHWCGMDAIPDCMGILHPDREYYGVYARGNATVALLLPEQLLLEEDDGFEWILRNTTAPESAVFQLTDQKSQRLRNLLFRLFDDHQTLTCLEHDPLLVGLFREWVLEEFRSLIDISLIEKGSHKTKLHSSNSRYFRQSIELIEQQITHTLSTRQIASRIGITPRMLQYVFQHQLGLTPTQYILRRKLQLAREALQDPQTQPVSITEIAMIYGITHLGRFSNRYKMHFGETPSQTFRGRDRVVRWKPVDDRSTYQRIFP